MRNSQEKSPTKTDKRTFKWCEDNNNNNKVERERELSRYLNAYLAE